MALSWWFCTNNTRNMLVKIVHPGGRVELHDRPMLAAEIMLRYPRCCVTYPHVFREPSAVVAADGVLMLGQKYYVVPTGTIRKLQQHHLRRSPSSSPSPLRRLHASKNPRSPQRHVHTSQTPNHNQLTPPKVVAGEGMESTCWLFTNKGTPKSDNCLNQADDETDRSSTSTVATLSTKGTEKQQSLSGESCFECLLRVAKSTDGKDLNQSGADCSSETKELKKKTGSSSERNGMKGSPKVQFKDVLGISFSDHWQPSLESINEEHPY